MTFFSVGQDIERSQVACLADQLIQQLGEQRWASGRFWHQKGQISRALIDDVGHLPDQKLSLSGIRDQGGVAVGWMQLSQQRPDPGRVTPGELQGGI